MPINISHPKKDIVSIKPLHSGKADRIINEVKKTIINENCSSLVLDLSSFNMFDSIRIGTIIATYHFIQFINGKIYIIVQDNLAKSMIENFKLKNATIMINKEKQVIYSTA
jgi:anti-anti-sigma regulatory factor